MVDLVVLLVADYANVEKKDKLNVMGIFGEISAPRFPARHPEMYLVARLSASPAYAVRLVDRLQELMRTLEEGESQ